MLFKMKLFRKKNKKERAREPVKKDNGILARRINGRMKIVGIFTAAAMVMLLLWILCMAITKNSAYEQKALSQLNYTNTTLVAKSGEIYDANMTPIAVSNRVYILILDPKVILETENTKGRGGSLDATVKAIAQCFQLDADEVREAVLANKDKMYLRFKGKTLVTEEQKQQFDALQETVNSSKNETEAEAFAPAGAKVVGVWFETEYQRYYPYGTLASKVIGFTTKDSTEGIWGLERYYNDELRGVNGRKFGYIDSEGNLGQEVIPQTDGNSLVSTIDINLTRLIKDTMDQWAQETDEEGERVHRYKEYSVLAMDPNTGAVKAIVTNTDYNLNDPSDLSLFYTEEEIAFFAENEARLEEYELTRESGAEQTESLMLMLPGDTFLENGEWNHEDYPTTTDIRNTVWRNGVISNSFEPGSTGKVITYAAALEEGLISEDTIFEDPEGFSQVGRTIVKCHNYATGGCGTIDAMEAMAQSCNVAFMEIGEMLGAARFVKYQNLHNFGQKTGIDLPGETSCEGLVFTESQLGELELATSAFGQCYNVTMIQLAAAFCADINGGYYYKPYTVQKILDENGNVVKQIEPTLVRQVISEETSAAVRRSMEYTVTNGTAYGVQVADWKNGVKMEGYYFGGKTGTAQKLPRSENKYIISLISTAPIDAPKLVLYVVLDEYEGELEDEGSAPVQYISGKIWNAIKDYIGLYSDLDPDVNSYEWKVEAGNDGYGSGEQIFSDTEGDETALPVPPIQGDVPEESIANPEEYINPEDALEVPMFIE